MGREVGGGKRGFHGGGERPNGSGRPFEVGGLREGRIAAGVRG